MLNGKFTLANPQENLVLNGHNNLVLVKCKIKNVVISGHNNRIFYQGGRNPTPAILHKVVTQGHNNTIENVFVQHFTLLGHNNIIKNLKYLRFSNRGVENKFSNCTQLTEEEAFEIFGHEEDYESLS